MSRYPGTKGDEFRPLTARIEQVRDALGLSAREFCHRIGFDYGRYAQVIGKRRSKPSADLLAAVAAHTDVSPDWLLNGAGPPFRDALQKSGGRLEEDYVLLRLYEVHGAAGEGALVHGEEVDDLLAFRRDWITQELRTSPERLFLIHVRGESMVPTLNPGDVILIEQANGAPAVDGIYVIRMGGALLVKRLQFLPDGQLSVSSDNPAYQPFRVTLREAGEDFAVVGRVVWAGRRF